MAGKGNEQLILLSIYKSAKQLCFRSFLKHIPSNKRYNFARKFQIYVSVILCHKNKVRPEWSNIFGTYSSTLSLKEVKLTLPLLSKRNCTSKVSRFWCSVSFAFFLHYS